MKGGFLGRTGRVPGCLQELDWEVNEFADKQ